MLKPSRSGNHWSDTFGSAESTISGHHGGDVFEQHLTQPFLHLEFLTTLQVCPRLIFRGGSR
jgi:hypothetical protein